MSNTYNVWKYINYIIEHRDYNFIQILTLKSDSEAIKSSNSRVAEEAVGQTVRVVVVVVSSIINFETICPLLLNKYNL